MTSIGLRIVAHHEYLRADLAEAALAIERLRAFVALPDAEPQLACAARARLRASTAGMSTRATPCPCQGLST